MVIEIGCTKVVNTPIGRLAISGSDKAVVELAFLMGDAKRLDFSSSTKAEAQVDKAIKWVTAYFAGERDDYSGELDLAGTEFQRAVWAEISKIKHGQTLSYGEIAKLIARHLPNVLTWF